MKALIVIEIPEDHFLVTANDLYERLKGYKCDLKPMPNKRVPEGSETDQIYGCYVGWNACIEEIVGETE